MYYAISELLMNLNNEPGKKDIFFELLEALPYNLCSLCRWSFKVSYDVYLQLTLFIGSTCTRILTCTLLRVKIINIFDPFLHKIVRPASLSLFF